MKSEIFETEEKSQYSFVSFVATEVGVTVDLPKLAEAYSSTHPLPPDATVRAGPEVSSGPDSVCSATPMKNTFFTPPPHTHTHTPLSDFKYHNFSLKVVIKVVRPEVRRSGGAPIGENEHPGGVEEK